MTVLDVQAAILPHPTDRMPREPGARVDRPLARIATRRGCAAVLLVLFHALSAATAAARQASAVGCRARMRRVDRHHAYRVTANTSGRVRSGLPSGPFKCGCIQSGTWRAARG